MCIRDRSRQCALRNSADLRLRRTRATGRWWALHDGASMPRAVWRRCWWPGGYPPSIEASLRPGVLPEANAMSGRYRSLRLAAPLVARAPGTWSHRAADAAGLREALCPTAEERRD